MRDNPILYHYTSIEGIKGILSSKYLRATNIGHLNDLKEFVHIFELIEEICLDFATLNDIKGEISSTVSTFVRSVKDKNLVVGSFSSDNDCLSLWRGYGYFSIGFKLSRIGYLCREQNFRNSECHYDDDLKRSKIRESLRKRIADSPNRTPESRNARSYLGTLLRHWDIQALEYKNRYFIDEREWRIFPILPGSISNCDMRYYSRNGTQTSYFPFNLHSHGKLIVDEIRFGPGVAQEEMDDIKQFAQMKNAEVLSYGKSKIPYRTETRN